MPSVGMRRSTRVFGARVLRSGRRLSTARYEGSKHIRAAHGENKWTELLHNSVDGGGGGGRYKSMWQENEIDSADMTVDASVKDELEMKEVDRPCRIVYKRKKRKWVEVANVALEEDQRFRKKYARKQWRRKSGSEAFENFGTFWHPVDMAGGFALAVTKSDYDCGYLFTCLLVSILRYVAKVRIGMQQLSEFLLSKPLWDVYSARGVLFFQDSITSRNLGACLILGSRFSKPLFSISASAAPSSFVHMQTSMHFRFACLDCLFVAHSQGVYEDIEITTYHAEECSLISVRRDHRDCCSITTQGSSGRDTTHSDVVTYSSDTIRKKELLHSAPVLPKYALRNLQIRNSRKIRKRRSSLRRKRGRPTSAFRSLKTTGALHSDVFRIRQDGVQLAAPPTGLSGSYKNSLANIKDLKSVVGVPGACANCCSANLLISESDRCYREEGATVTLEFSSSNQWFIVVLKDGTKRYNLVAQKAMRPSWNNRFTHATIWMSDSGWKLEFPNRRNWLIFKELYKECYDRNLKAPPISVIPVPGVHEVSNTVEADHFPYVRPASYITMKDDELTRALEKKSANYDMDSEDELWLSKLNEQFAGRGLEELVTPDCFELVIDGIEKATHCNQDEHLDGQAAGDFCMHLERREVVEAIHNYWIKKRKENQSALVRIFQLYQPRRTQMIPKSVLRKKRSFKRQTSQGGRGKQRPLLQAIAAKQDVSKQKNVHKLQEAKAAAERSEFLAMQKRQRAQMLMENADLSTYRALMALRIAEAAQTAGKLDTSTSFFLG